MNEPLNYEEIREVVRRAKANGAIKRGGAPEIEKTRFDFTPPHVLIPKKSHHKQNRK